MHAALGFQARTGWAALVALAGPAEMPTVALRRRVELVDDTIPAHVFHAAQEARDPRALVKRAERTARTAGRRAVREAVHELEQAGHRVVGMALGVGSGKVPDRLDAILASHALVHAAEGELYRRVLIDAGEHDGLRVIRLPRKELDTTAAQELGIRPAALREHLAALGKAVGSPWRQEQKEAALSAWVALGARRSR
ncbi:MAG: hypothetical protein ACRDY4_16665 [Acidimicrobiia bacterium]